MRASAVRGRQSCVRQPYMCRPASLLTGARRPVDDVADDADDLHARRERDDDDGDERRDGRARRLRQGHLRPPLHLAHRQDQHRDLPRDELARLPQVNRRTRHLRL